MQHPLQHLSPELQLLLFAASTPPQEDMSTRVPALVKEIDDWDHLLELVKRNELVSPMYRCLAADAGEAVSAAVRTNLRSMFLGTVVHTLCLKGELVHLLRLCAKEGLPALPFKGPVLAEALYDSIALRQFNDVDILFHRQDVGDAIRIIRSMGYQPRIELTEKNLKRLFRRNCEITFSCPERGSVIELHWDFLPRAVGPAANCDFLWSGSQESEFEGQPCHTLSPKSTLLMLLLHGSLKHGWTELKMVADVAGMLHQVSDLDVEWVLYQATLLGCERETLTGFNLAKTLLAARGRRGSS